MSDSLVRLYHRLPSPMWSVAATLRGLYLRSWRYGQETEGLVEESLERESWDLDRWRRWQEERIAHLLHRAATRVPYYRDQWATRRRRGDKSSWEYIENWPVLTKEPLRQNPMAFVADDRDTRAMFREHTSGTSGTPLQLWWSKKTVRSWYALFEARLRRWNGVSRHDNWAILGGQPVVPAARRTPPFWVWNAAMRQLYLSANHISRQNIGEYVTAMEGYGVTHLIAYSSSASLLAREAGARGLQVKGLAVVITNAEALFPWQRDVMRETLAPQIRETYGMTEIVLAASECSNARLHLWPEVGWLEILSDTEDLSVPLGTSGRLVATGLLNDDMPLVRYAIGDRGRRPLEDVACGCGRKLPTLAAIEGRQSDLLVARDGRRVYWLNPIFSGLPIREAQIVQETLDQILIRYVPVQGSCVDTERSIVTRLQGRMGHVKVIFEQVQRVPREANGKFKAVVCNLSESERDFVSGPDARA